MPFLPDKSLHINMASEFSVNCTFFPLLTAFRVRIGTLKGCFSKLCKLIPDYGIGKCLAQSMQLLIAESYKETLPSE